MSSAKKRTKKKNNKRKQRIKKIKQNISLLLLIIIILLFIFIGKNYTKEEVKELIKPKSYMTEELVLDEDYEIPEVYFKGNIYNMTNKKDERMIEIEYKSKEKTFKSYAKIKIQGTSSLAYPKKNYTISLYEDEKYENKNKVDLRWGEQSKYCLKANWIDKTHARNIVSAQIAGDAQEKYNVLTDSPNNGSIDGYPVKIYSNNKFLGLYTWNIPKDDWTWNMDDENPNHIVFSNEGWENSNLFLEPAKSFEEFELEVGEETEENLDKLNRLITFVRYSTDEEFKKNFKNYLDLDSTLNYYVIMIYAELVDNVAKNMMLATYDGEIWYPTLYDLDTSWGTTYNGTKTLDYNDTHFIKKSYLWKRLEENFPKEIQNRYKELREEILTKENIMQKFNNLKKQIPEELFKKDKEKWYNELGYDYKQIEDFLDKRTPIVDEYIKGLSK